MRLWRRREIRAVPSHPVTVRVSLKTADVVIEGLDAQIEAITRTLTRAGLTLIVDSQGLCG